ncbi:acyltransferase family protein [Parasporobacterium paucivorans]|uniref:Fucose 4-O-acetylase n=1 Tax=Parasporobacterium paucivorans DSM 15970 TaxID=1122934 RepID=A0A1M6FJU2_9FIRM|nr:acyltransferase [Parasporobacterium paucivorans]SHI97899.1 Fucose 4-O-acetylase [Parasporobacterium paucivorans DSM 15970]
MTTKYIQPRSGRVMIFDYLKAVAIFLVIANHTPWSDQELRSPFVPFLINMAVPIFMIVSGYTLALTSERQYDENISSLYKLQIMKKKISRYLLPYFMIFILQILAEVFIRKAGLEFRGVFSSFITGGYGPGSYYIPVFFQVILLYPFIFRFFLKGSLRGLFICGILNIMYEIAVTIVLNNLGAYRPVIGETYRLIMLRYLFMIALGTWLYFNKNVRIKKSTLAIMFAVGLSYLLLLQYTDFRLRIFNFWQYTCMITAFYIFPIFYLVFRKFRKIRMNSFVSDILMLIGKASFHIYLVQMLYYHYFGFRIWRIITADKVIQMLINILICCLGGIALLKLEQLLRGSSADRK